MKNRSSSFPTRLLLLTLFVVAAVLLALWYVPSVYGRAPSERQAVARWDAVPFGAVSQDAALGFLAFHPSGIDRVEFSAGGRPLAAARAPSYNPASRVVEFWFVFKPQLFAAGPVSVTATAFPVNGLPRSADLPLRVAAPSAPPQVWVSPNGSDNANGTASAPFKTVHRAARALAALSPSQDAGGGVVNLLAGKHAIGPVAWADSFKAELDWLTIRPSPGVERAAVEIASWDPNGLGCKLVRLESLTVLCTMNGRDPMDDFLWLDRCLLKGQSRSQPSRWCGAWQGVWATDCQVQGGANGIEGAQLQRRTNVSGIGSDAFSNSYCLVDCAASDIDHTGTQLHPDVYQFYGVGPNVILYGLKATDGIKGQGLFAGAGISVTDAAFVNCQIDNQVAAGGVGYAWQFMGPTTNLYVKDCKITGPARWAPESGFTARDVVIEATTFGPGGLSPAQAAGVDIRAAGPAQPAPPVVVVEVPPAVPAPPAAGAPSTADWSKIMSSFDRTSTHIRDLLMQDKPIGSSHAQNADSPSIDDTDRVELLPAPGDDYRYEVVQFIMVNRDDGTSPVVILGDDTADYWEQRVGDPGLAQGQAEQLFTPRRLWPENKPVTARLVEAGGTVKVYLSAYRVQIDPESKTTPKEALLNTSKS